MKICTVDICMTMCTSKICMNMYISYMHEYMYMKYTHADVHSTRWATGLTACWSLGARDLSQIN